MTATSASPGHFEDRFIANFSFELAINCEKHAHAKLGRPSQRAVNTARSCRAKAIIKSTFVAHRAAM
jgi:hypothetical protein